MNSLYICNTCVEEIAQECPDAVEVYIAVCSSQNVHGKFLYDEECDPIFIEAIRYLEWARYIRTCCNPNSKTLVMAKASCRFNDALLFNEYCRERVIHIDWTD